MPKQMLNDFYISAQITCPCLFDLLPNTTNCVVFGNKSKQGKAVFFQTSQVEFNRAPPLAEMVVLKWKFKNVCIIIFVGLNDNWQYWLSAKYQVQTFQMVFAKANYFKDFYFNLSKQMMTDFVHTVSPKCVKKGPLEKYSNIVNGIGCEKCQCVSFTHMLFGVRPDLPQLTVESIILLLWYNMWIFL